MKTKISKKDICIFSITCLILLFFLFVFAPGILTYDSYNQLQQISSRSFNNWHPFLHTFIEMILLKIWNDPSMIGVFQIITFSLIWTSICHYNRKDSRSNFIFQIIFTILICTNPINFLYSMTLWKDILFSYILLLVCLLSQILYDNKFKCSNKFCILLGIFLSIFSEIRYNGLYIVVILLIVFCILFYKNDRKNKMFIKLPLICIAGILLISSLNILYKVKDNEKDAIEPKIMQYLSFHLKEKTISKKDRDLIEKVADTKKLIEVYNPTFSDNTYGEINHKKYNKYKKDMMMLAVKYSFNHPDIFIKFGTSSTSFIWNPTFPKETIGLIFSTDISSLNNTKNLKPYNINKSYYHTINNKINYTLNNRFLKIILYNPSFYMYLGFIIMIILWIVYRYNSIFIVLPNLLNLLIVAVSNPIHDVRYIYPNILVFYLLVITLFGKERKSNERKNIENHSK